MLSRILLPHLSDDEYRQYFRVNRRQFNDIHDFIKDDIRKKSTFFRDTIGTRETCCNSKVKLSMLWKAVKFFFARLWLQGFSFAIVSYIVRKKDFNSSFFSSDFAIIFWRSAALFFSASSNWMISLPPSVESFRIRFDGFLLFCLFIYFMRCIFL